MKSKDGGKNSSTCMPHLQLPKVALRECHQFAGSSSQVCSENALRGMLWSVECVKALVEKFDLCFSHSATYGCVAASTSPSSAHLPTVCRWPPLAAAIAECARSSQLQLKQADSHDEIIGHKFSLSSSPSASFRSQLLPA